MSKEVQLTPEEAGLTPEEAGLTPEEAGSPGCGSGTENACSFLVRGPDGLACALLLPDGKIAQWAVFMSGFRINLDPADGLPWCPKEVLKDSKVPPGKSTGKVSKLPK